MSDGRDAEDASLLDSGEHALRLATYEPVIIGRCVARCAGASTPRTSPVRSWKPPN